MKSRIDRQPYQQPDLDSIEELNYISTVKEDEVIDRHIDTLREWEYGSISHVHDLHQLEFCKPIVQDAHLDYMTEASIMRQAAHECTSEIIDLSTQIKERVNMARVKVEHI